MKYAYRIVINGEIHLFHHDSYFREDEVREMIREAVSELRWYGRRKTYGNEINYLVDQFGFEYRG